VRAEIKVSGIVQGVGFRPFIYRIAVANGLVGFVQNRGDAYVEIVVEGDKDNIAHFLQDIKTRKPPLADIHQIITKYEEGTNDFQAFNIKNSSDTVELSGSIIPSDVSICDDCLAELRDPENKRHNYFFITCTNCGPRYTTIEQLPYDRHNTTMQEFPLCDFCKREYLDPANRRFHAETVACPRCGPDVQLGDKQGNIIGAEDPIREAGKLLDEGYILAVKGYGGFHVATATTRDEPIRRLRAIKHRAQKPFAIMARDLETVKTFARATPREEELLTSHIRPILLLQKTKEYYLSKFIAPDLHNIGVMLPYTGLHYLLFDGTREPAFVMTSANPANEPIVTDNKEAVTRLAGVVDYYLFHNRVIAQRCDDSVIRVHGENPSLIRRSRGYAPEAIRLKLPEKHCILGVGAELNTTSCVLLKDKAFISQHIGDVENVETLQFLEKATRHIMRLANGKPEAVACDLHPKFTTTAFAHNIGDELNIPVVGVQHHHAHASKLMAEHGLDEIVAIVCDGYGYGLDGQAWGGEILNCNRAGFDRLGHLERQPLIGGDLATRYPVRIAAGILREEENMQDWLISNSKYLPHGKEEVEVILKQMKQPLAFTTSCGRVLDGATAVLGLCYERTYEGEPAMKLEAAAARGKDVLNLTPQTKDNVLSTSFLIRELFRNRRNFDVEDLAFSVQSYLSQGLAEIAVSEAKRLGIGTIGFSGGVAYNEHFVHVIRKIVEDHGLSFCVNELVPCGDGGISFGQAVAACWQANH
jgi:hydrogenase maturation protein HypF